MAAILLVIAIAISMVVVRIGATALELTGMPWDRAKFQALSAFSNAGFTTRESEEIVRHPLRRKIVTYLIVLGNAGLVTVIGSVAGSVIEPQPIHVLGRVAAMAAVVAALFWLARRPPVARRLRERVRRWIARRYAIEMWSAEELLHLDHGYELTRFDLSPDSPAIGHTLRQLKLRQNAVQVLAVERGLRFVAVPGGRFRPACRGWPGGLRQSRFGRPAAGARRRPGPSRHRGCCRGRAPRAVRAATCWGFGGRHLSRPGCQVHVPRPRRAHPG